MRRGILANAALTIVFQGVGVLTGVLLGIVIARELGPLGRGAFAYATVSLGVLLTYAEGVSSATIAQYKTDGLSSALVYRAMLRVLGWAALVLGGGTALCGVLLPGQGLLLAVACALPFALYVGAANGFLVADGQVQRANAVNAVSCTGLALVVVPLLLFAHAPVRVVLAAWVGSYVAAALLAAIWTRWYFFGEVDPAEIGPAARAQTVFSLKSATVFLLAYLNLRVDMFVVSAMLGPVELGWYSLAISAGELLWKWAQALYWSAYGRIASSELPESAALVAKLTRTIFALQSAVAMALFLGAPWLIPAVYGERFGPSVDVLRMLLPGILAYTLEMGFGYFIMVKLKRPMWIASMQVASTLGCLLLTMLLLPKYGLRGAAFATSTTYVAVTLASAAVFLRATKLGVREVFTLKAEDFIKPITEGGKHVRRLLLSKESCLVVLRKAGMESKKC